MKWPRVGRSQAMTPAEHPCLTPEELIEFHARYTEVQRARSQAVMLNESFLGWMRAMGEKYRVGTYFDVDPNDGRLIQKIRPATLASPDGSPCPT